MAYSNELELGEQLWLNEDVPFSYADYVEEGTDTDNSPSSGGGTDSGNDSGQQYSPLDDRSQPSLPDNRLWTCGESQIKEAVMHAVTEKKNLLLECPPGMKRKVTVLKTLLQYLKENKESFRGKIYIGTRHFLETKNFLEEMKADFLGSTDLLKNIKLSILGHRGDFCLNEQVTSGGAGGIDHSCRKLVSQQRYPNLPSVSKKPRDEEEERSCEYFRTTADGAIPFARESFGGIGQEINDLEDFMDFCQGTNRCPYFDALYQAEGSQLIISSAEFLLSAFLREEYPFNLDENTILFIDDGYDLENLCRKEATIEMSLDDLNKSSAIIRAVNEDCQLNHREECGLMELEAFLPNLASFVRENEREDPGKDENLGAINQLNMESVNVSELLGRVLEYAEKAASRISDADAKVIDKLRKFLTILPLVLENNDSFMVKNTTRVSPSNPNRLVTYFQLICTDPSLILKPIAESISSLIIGADITAPYDTFHSEFGVTFQEERIRYDDPILKERLLFMYACEGVTGKEIALEYNTRGEAVVKKEVGHSLVEILKAIPNGKIALFHSGDYLKQLVKFWKNTSIEPGGPSIMELIEGTVTTVFSELSITPETDIDGFMRNFETVASSSERGALLLALHRGDLYTNWDLKYKSVRGIVHVSLPWGALPWDDQIQSKRLFLEGKERGRPEIDEWRNWYHCENFRVLNPSLRIVKPEGKNDWGVVIVLDSRMVNESRQFDNLLPEWVSRPTNHRQFSSFMLNLREKVQEWGNYSD